MYSKDLPRLEMANRDLHDFKWGDEMTKYLGVLDKVHEDKHYLYPLKPDNLKNDFPGTKEEDWVIGGMSGLFEIYFE